MSLPASQGQLRASFLRWALVIVPAVSLAGFTAGRLSGGADNPWFDGLAKPALFPPPATFGIVWSVLYVMIGVALTLVVTARGAPGRGAAIAAFLIQLALNLAWSPLFFGAHQVTAALWLLLALDVAVIVTVVLFWKVRPLAAWLLLPYLAWVLFATVLNWQFDVLNPDAETRSGSGAVTRYEL